jgi:pyruvate kinase
MHDTPLTLESHSAISDNTTLEHVFQQVSKLVGELADFEKSQQATLERVSGEHLPSARNLLHYLAFRKHDVRGLQKQLSALGLSSLGRSEASILSTLQQVLKVLSQLTDRALPLPLRDAPDCEVGKSILAAKTSALFGPNPPKRHVRIMVTMSAEAAESYEHVRDLLASGMDCMRINCAHDDADAWKRMIDHLQRAKQELGHSCCVLMDLGGPKLRTGPIAPGAPIHRWKPKKDVTGRALAPVRVWLADSEQQAPPGVDFHLPIPRALLKGIRHDDQIAFRDARGARRKLDVVEVAAEGVIAECEQTAYVMPALKLRLRRRERPGKKRRTLQIARLRDLPPTKQAIVVKPGERLIVTSDQQLGQPAVRDEADAVVEPARIGCTLPDVFADLCAGQHIWFDDGKIGGRIVKASDESIEVEVIQASSGGSKLAEDKGINLPDSKLRLPALTAKDLDDLAFVVKHADLVGYSFVRTHRDVTQLQERLHALGGNHLGIILKIETRHAFEQLPHLLLAAMRSGRAGVMIARGDLAIECGFERLAELQEEILWFSEAAHMPVIWATQVLEHLTKEGTPSRAEVTDAAMGERAECVMLNKGPHIGKAVRALDDILKRMADHQDKKRSMLRPLKLAGQFCD